MNGITLALVLGGVLCMTYYHPAEKRPGIPKFIWLPVIASFFFCLFTMYFLRNNSFLIIALAVFLLVMGSITAIRRLGIRMLTLAGLNLLVYLICLAPMVTTGAFTHGYGPWMECHYTFSYATRYTLIAYARANHWHLPTARSMPELAKQLQPYGSEFFGYYGAKRLPAVCRAGEFYDRHPQPYIWNTAMAGKSIDELRALPKPVKLITCPYHSQYSIWSSELVDAYNEEKK
jgi:hypothetical protein